MQNRLGRKGLSDVEIFMKSLWPESPIKSRKGLSDIVTAVLLILVGIAIVGIVAYAVFGVARAPALSPGWSCIDMKTNQVLSVEKACYDSVDDELVVMVKRTLDEKFDLEEFDFILDNDQGSSTWRVGGVDCVGCEVVGIGSSKLYYFDSGDGVEMKDMNKVILKAYGCGVDEAKIKAC